MKIKFGEVSIEVPRPNPELFKDLFKLTYTSFSNYLEECAECAEKYAKTGKSPKGEDE